MSKPLVRLIKAFILSSVAVYMFLNGPSLYTHAKFWYNSLRPEQSTATVSASAIKPIKLPVSDLESTERPLPKEATLTIEKIQVSVPIVFGLSTDADTIYKNLSNGVVHYSATSKPGQSGASIILCHSSLYPWQYNKYGAPCALIDKLELGDKFTIRYSDGRTFSYIMKESLVFDPLTGKDNERLAEFEIITKPSLFLVTCYPINSTSYRKTVKAEII